LVIRLTLASNGFSHYLVFIVLAVIFYGVYRVIGQQVVTPLTNALSKVDKYLADARRDYVGNAGISVAQIFAFIGSGLLIFGVFCPVLSIPILGNLTYVQLRTIEGLSLVAFGVLSAVLALRRLVLFTILPTLGSVGMLFYSFVTVANEMQSTHRDAPGIQLDKLVGLQWGAGILVLGVIALFIAVSIEKRSRT
jgi:hypothetical protein